MTLRPTSDKPHRYAKRHANDFDLSEMLSVQSETRLTKTPPFVLFDTIWAYIKNRPANSNNHFTK